MSQVSKAITLVTANPSKLAEWQRLFPADYALDSVAIDLDEIQSLDLEAIVIDKARRAYEQLGTPVLVEDTSAGLVKLSGLPGPFIKFFELEMGRDALFQLAGAAGEAAIVTAIIGYFDGSHTITARGDVTGSVVAARGENGFGFDVCFVPDGGTKTFAEMTASEKDSLSHRAMAVSELVRQMRELL